MTSCLLHVMRENRRGDYTVRMGIDTMTIAKDNRPNPDELLTQMNQENRGRLTVFLGAAAGVGKTYTMLKAAQEDLLKGKQVYIGWIETHGRVETEKLSTGIPVIPPAYVSYRGQQKKEMDTDAILHLKPEIVLVDELAHTNIPGSRHVRRYQDVEELLDAGIQVYTTINIQHIESLNDIVTQITGVAIHETVPDSVLEQADSIQLIDIPPEELVTRLQEGKVYSHEQAVRALKNFFRLGNINALRELALRFMANRVDDTMSAYMKKKKIAGPWQVTGRVMVCVSASPFSTQLIRTARRLADGLHADFLAVHIEMPTPRFPMGNRERARLADNIKLAEELGGKIFTAVGNDLVHEILDIARTHNVTAIVAGKSQHGRLWDICHGAFLEKLIRYSGDINVYVVQGEEEKEKEKEKEKNPIQSHPLEYKNKHKQIWYTVCGISMALCITGVGWIFQSSLELINIAFLYFLPVLLSALWWGRWPSYMTAVVSVFLFDFSFIPPIFTTSVNDIQYIWTFGIFLIFSYLIGKQTEKLRKESKIARQREKSMRTLYDFSQEIAAIIKPGQICQKLAEYVGETLDRFVVVLYPDKKGQLKQAGQYIPETGGHALRLVEQEYAVAVWAFKNKKMAGCSTDTIPGVQNLYIPLQTGAQIEGVFGIQIGDNPLLPEEKRIIDSWIRLTAMAIERCKLIYQSQQAALAVESERLRTSLFNSVSHELRTPLASIIGAASALSDTTVQYNPKEQLELLETISYGATRMERLVNNFLDTARQESGILQLKNDWCDIEDIIGVALQRVEKVSVTHNIVSDISSPLPFFKGDCGLLEQVLVNLLDNAIKYSPKGSTIAIRAYLEHAHLVVSVKDQGIGILSSDQEHIFEKFYRSSNVNTISGTGLGLFICKGIIEMHHGTIWAENNPGGGAAISFSLPVDVQENGIQVKGRDTNGCNKNTDISN